jgi:hypothetical protein
MIISTRGVERLRLVTGLGMAQEVCFNNVMVEIDKA